MTKLLDNAGMDVMPIPDLTGFQYSAAPTDCLGADEYTLVTIAVDTSTSVRPFRDLLVQMVRNAVEGCRMGARKYNTMVRVIGFASGVTEIHGFKPALEIDLSVYDALQAGGSTALYDAAASAVGATVDYARALKKQDYGAKGLMFVITDGDNNTSKFGAEVVARKIREALSGETVEDFASVLVGVNAAEFRQRLEDFQKGAGISAYIDAKDASPGTMAKIGGIISRSVSSSGSQGTGLAAQFTSGPITI
jgi:hypothetical protein